MPDLDLTFVDRTVEQVGGGPEAVIPILQRLQEHYHYLPDEALRRVCADQNHPGVDHGRVQLLHPIPPPARRPPSDSNLCRHRLPCEGCRSGA